MKYEIIMYHEDRVGEASAGVLLSRLDCDTPLHIGERIVFDENKVRVECKIVDIVHQPDWNTRIHVIKDKI